MSHRLGLIASLLLGVTLSTLHVDAQSERDAILKAGNEHVPLAAPAAAVTPAPNTGSFAALPRTAEIMNLVTNADKGIPNTAGASDVRPESPNTTSDERPQEIYSRLISSRSVRSTVRTRSAQALQIDVEARRLGFSINAESVGTRRLVIGSADEELQKVLVGEMGHAPFVLVVSKRADDMQNIVVAIRGEETWETRVVASAGPDDDVRILGSYVVVAERAEPDGERDYLYGLISPKNDPAMIWVPRRTVSVSPMATDAGISSAEDAALHVTAFNEGTLAPWDCPNQPYDGTGGFLYGRTSGNSDGALLSFGIFQWNFWSGTLPPMLRRFEQIDSTAFWSAFNGLDVAAFRSEVMSSTTTVARSYEWARQNVPGGAWLTSNGVACSGYAASDCRWRGGSMLMTWRDAFSKLGSVSAFQAEERNSAIDSYITPVKNGRYQALNAATSRTWSLRSLLVLIDFANQYGPSYGDSTSCSFSAWITNSTGCSRNTTGTNGYSAALNDQSNTKRLPAFLEPSTYRYRRDSIATGDGTVNVYDVYPAWDAYFARYNVSLNAPPGSSSSTGPPAAPSGLSASTLSSSSIKFSWVDNSNNETSFNVALWNGSSWTTIGSVGSNVTSFTDTGRQASTTYYYTVCAQNGAGTNCASTYATATTQSAASTTAPTAPSGLSASALSSSSIRFSWIDNSNNETSFIVALWNGSAWTTISSVGSNVTSFVDTGRKASTTYYYTVCAQNGAGTNCASTYATATTP